MANRTITTDLITKHALAMFKNESVLLAKVDRQLDKEFTKKYGDTVNVRKRVRYASNDGADITGNISDTIEGSVPVQLEFRKNVAFQFDSEELTLDIEEFSDRYIKPAMVELVQVVESTIASQYKKIWNFTGTPGTQPSSFLDIANVGALMDEGGVPYDDRYAFYGPRATVALADGLKSVFPQKIATKAIENALISEYAGFTLYKSMSLQTHTVGNYAGTPLVNGAAQDVTYTSVADTYEQTLVTDGWDAASELNEGDTFTIDGVFAVNPRTRKSTSRLQDFVVRADSTADGTGNATLTISPAIIASGPYQTVSAAPADNAAITVTSGTAGSSHVQNLAFNKNAITAAFAQLDMPKGSVDVSRDTLDGVSMRVVKDYDVLKDVNIIRLDILFGVEVQNPGFAVRHTS